MSAHASNLVGATFGRLTVLARTANTKGGKTRWLCVCACGNFRTARQDHLVGRKIVSCNCYWSERRAESHTTHGATKGDRWAPEYSAWCAMKQRCSSPARGPYHAAMGVKVCAEWQHDFARFLSDVGKKPSPKHSLDRFPDPHGNYEPGNVRWATPREQYLNQRKFHPLPEDTD